MRRDDVRLRISREAARLFLSHGVAEVSGDAIGAAAGVSTRTVWRHFRNKESCIEPVLTVSIQRFARILKDWPLDDTLEAHLRVAMPLDGESPTLISDGAMAVRLVALCDKEPAIRTVWLDAYHALELEVREVVARRANRSVLDYDVRLCAATIVAAIRTIDEAISVAAVSGERSYTSIDLARLMADAIRTAATLPICDAIERGLHTLLSRRSAGAADN
ncbi:TetR/AcrR family transcriptional regulator [Sphingomonas zeicaulis]|uniref:TetR/AcrR family transcriptional regulator n=1 Tax=Sphingomonas zeicaulis TaxID=1632740 RepID=UPI003D22119D